ncbi:glycoside hydrolase family 15 protein [Gaiella sp.]|jgi:GH15 family glucan-1,4-alpha-glucosidase|uniref:glycoside hydrolase family 15 protein n=1 Tax=Gaiella sp. TaxID=2663207 RepID=UPI002E36C871|nr:glycoside hydrolase family 15 protein [Gaiella sp.]HEX5584818.1 glycoside hydrolase family 15 protein [Gaiella sp.]
MTRRDGYLPIRDYAAIGDGRTVALVGRDGAVDWLCLPDVDSASVFAALLDPERGGRFTLGPSVAFSSERRYVPGTNVLETTFSTATGVVRVTDAMTLPGGGLVPYRELARRVDGLAGDVPMRWRVEPRFAYGAKHGPFALHGGVPVAAHGRDAISVSTWEAGATELGDDAVGGRFNSRSGESSLLALSAAHKEPLVFPPRHEVESRLEGTVASWQTWASERSYDGRWRDAVLRSALALKLLVFAPSGAIAAAATTSLPEEIGGLRNWDYRFSWPRDAAFTLQALLALGCGGEARAFFSWLLHASQLTHPRLQVLYRLNGRADADERELPLAGYRRSSPVRVGNGAAEQLQLDVYGEVLSAAALYAHSAGGLDRDHGRRIAQIADLVCDLWRKPDAGIWEVRAEATHFIESKMMCAVALDHAVALAEARYLPTAGVGRWQRESAAVRDFVEQYGYSETKGSYTRAVGVDDLDASLLLAILAGYDRPDAPRLVGTVEAIRGELATGPFVQRYLDGDGVPGEDGAFVACSFWLADALARQGRVEEASTLMDELVELANDVGLYAEEIDPANGNFLGNFPQGLSHLALINAAVAIAEATT